jgi:hypothetical protein
VFAVPDETVHRSKVADWLELKAITAPDGIVGFGTLVSAVALAENEQGTDIGDEDIEEDQLILCAQGEIARRLKNVGDDYPFRIDEKGRSLQLVAKITEVGAVYLFCLFLSHASDRTIVPRKLAPVVTNKTRDLFQACATLAAGGYVQGPAMSFGFPRPDGMDFLKALHEVYKKFGDGRPCKKPRKSAPPNVKDNGIDVIAWRRSIDQLPSTHYLIGQVASGNNWTEKSVKADREHFHKYWFVEAPGSQPEDAMFMPFGLEPDNDKKEDDYEDLLKDYMQNIAYRYGNLFYRDRIVRHAAEGLQRIAAGESDIQRSAELKDVKKWVKSYTERLRASA